MIKIFICNNYYLNILKKRFFNFKNNSYNFLFSLLIKMQIYIFLAYQIKLYYFNKFKYNYYNFLLLILSFYIIKQNLYII